jgi:signal peptidase I
MHPTLQDGDIVWVKKCSLLPWMSLFGNNKKHDHLLLVEKEEKEDGNNDFMNHQQQHAAEQEKARLIRYERMHGIVHPPGWFLQSIIPIPGQIIAYQNPYNPHREYIVQRVIGVGGQWIQRNAGSGNNNNNIHSYRFELLPIYNVFVEGDNQDHHPHSPFSEGRTVSRNLVTGVVETILWPPSRWQTIHHTTSNNNNNNNNKNHHPSWKDRARWT